MMAVIVEFNRSAGGVPRDCVYYAGYRKGRMSRTRSAMAACRFKDTIDADDALNRLGVDKREYCLRMIDV